MRRTFKGIAITVSRRTTITASIAVCQEPKASKILQITFPPRYVEKYFKKKTKKLTSLFNPFLIRLRMKSEITFKKLHDVCQLTPTIGRFR